jgi:hypothetical protein
VTNTGTSQVCSVVTKTIGLYAVPTSESGTYSGNYFGLGRAASRDNPIGTCSANWTNRFQSTSCPSLGGCALKILAPRDHVSIGSTH